jgi:hypothetical protein
VVYTRPILPSASPNLKFDRRLVRILPRQIELHEYHAFREFS